MLTRPIAVASVLTLALVGASIASAATLTQSSEAASLIVTVRDNWGVIPGATVMATNPQTGAATRALTDASGVATLTSLAPGVYQIRVTFSGFADHQQTVTLEANQKQEIEATLALAQFSTTITVTTANRREELLLKVADPTTLVDRAQIEDTGGRTAKDVLLEQVGAGVTMHPGGGQGHVSINGIPNSGVLVLVDGRRLSRQPPLPRHDRTAIGARHSCGLASTGNQRHLEAHLLGRVPL